jgi:hypothetical protein
MSVLSIVIIHVWYPRFSGRNSSIQSPAVPAIGRAVALGRGYRQRLPPAVLRRFRPRRWSRPSPDRLSIRGHAEHLSVLKSAPIRPADNGLIFIGDHVLDLAPNCHDRILTNLLTSAVKGTEEGQVGLLISKEIGGPDGGGIVREREKGPCFLCVSPIGSRRRSERTKGRSSCRSGGEPRAVEGNMAPTGRYARSLFKGEASLVSCFSTHPADTDMTILSSISLVLQQRTPFVADASVGTGLEWMTVAAVVLPALLLLALGALGRRSTV